jgi:4-hydroxybenzoate polyprenyltransferase
MVAATVVAPSPPRATSSARSRRLSLGTAARRAPAHDSAPDRPAFSRPPITATVAGTAPWRRTSASLYLDLIRWDRPAGWLLLLWPTLSALWIAADGFPGWHLLAVFVLGTVLMRSAGCCINDVADRDFDRHVKRTAQRPVTSGAVAVAEALALGAVLALLAFLLVLTTNPAAIGAVVRGAGHHAGLPLCQALLSMPQAVLGVAFSFGIPMAFAAVLGGTDWGPGRHHRAVPPQAWGLLLGNLFWVLAYDTEYAMVDRDDDLRIGMKTSAITLGRFDVAAVMAVLRAAPGPAGPGWAVAGPGGGTCSAWPRRAAQAAWHYTLIRGRSRDGCFKAFRLNHWVGFAVFAG